jgi:3',5'-nucleoside bisphosphate phosphatase
VLENWLFNYRAELHLHTVLSPCAEIEMLPPFIVEEALAKGIQMIAISDHNASANIIAVQKAAEGTGLVVLPGMEVQTREEVHVLCLFDHIDQINAWQEIVDRHLPKLQNDPEFFGEQLIVDETGDFIAREERLLITSTSLSIEKVFEEVNRLGGLAIPAHVDRTAFGLLANLGFVPPELPVEALEISGRLKIDEAVKRFPQLNGYPLIQSGDAHRLEEILGANQFFLAEPTISEIRMALRADGNRSLINLLHQDSC